jgi:hypothetical protein
MNEILFTDTMGIIPDYFPKPAKSITPEWYKNTKSYIGKKEVTESGITSTIKKCVPVLDILSAGYVIPTWCDIWVSRKDGSSTFRTQNDTMRIEYHPLVQLPLHPSAKDNEAAFKFMNPWSIRTPKGHSCLFAAPFHNPNPYFEVLSAVVDTDTYFAPVNFPFFLKNVEFEGLIPAGTPMIQVIPFKRQSWKMSFGNHEDEIVARKTTAELRTSIFNSYRTRFWNKKEFN